MSKIKLFKLSRGSFPTQLKGLLVEAQSIISKRQQIYRRHGDDIENYRRIGTEEHFLSNIVTTSQLVAESILKDAESSDSAYEFHIARKKYLEQIDKKTEVDIDELFSVARAHFGITPIYGAILRANLTLESMYDFSDHLDEPQLDYLAFDFLDIELMILRLYVAYVAEFGVDQLIRDMAAKFSAH